MYTSRKGINKTRKAPLAARMGVNEICVPRRLWSCGRASTRYVCSADGRRGSMCAPTRSAARMGVEKRVGDSGSRRRLWLPTRPTSFVQTTDLTPPPDTAHRRPSVTPRSRHRRSPSSPSPAADAAAAAATVAATAAANAPMESRQIRRRFHGFHKQKKKNFFFYFHEIPFS